MNTQAWDQRPQAPPSCTDMNQGNLGIKEPHFQGNDGVLHVDSLCGLHSPGHRAVRASAGFKHAESETSPTLEQHLGTLLLRVYRLSGQPLHKSRRACNVEDTTVA